LGASKIPAGLGPGRPGGGAPAPPRLDAPQHRGTHGAADAGAAAADATGDHGVHGDLVVAVTGHWEKRLENLGIFSGFSR